MKDVFLHFYDTFSSKFALKCSAVRPNIENIETSWIPAFQQLFSQNVF